MKRGNARSESKKDLRRKSSQGEDGRGKEAESLLQARAGGRRAGLDPTAGPGVGECFPASRVTGLGSPSLDFFQSLPCYSQQGHSQTGLPTPRGGSPQASRRRARSIWGTGRRSALHLHRLPEASFTVTLGDGSSQHPYFTEQEMETQERLPKLGPGL